MVFVIQKVIVKSFSRDIYFAGKNNKKAKLANVSFSNCGSVGLVIGFMIEFVYITHHVQFFVVVAVTMAMVLWGNGTNWEGGAFMKYSDSSLPHV